MSVHTYLFTPLPFFCLWPETGEDDNGGWVLQTPAMAGLMLSRVRLGSDAEFALPGWKRSKMPQGWAGSVSVSSPGRLCRVLFLEFIDQSFFFSPRDTYTHRCYTGIYISISEDLTAANTALWVSWWRAAEDHLRWSEPEGIGMVDQWGARWPPHVLTRCLLPASLQSEGKQKFALQVAI